MSKNKNLFWRFFASVKLALILLFILASVSIIGTFIKQNQGDAYYAQEYGLGLARLFQLLDISDMYSSWWFVTLLGIFSINLIVCSIERLPQVWRLVFFDNLTIDLHRLEKMRLTQRADVSLQTTAVIERIQNTLARIGWRNLRLDEKSSSLIFTQKGAWTRFSVYVIHLSILVILSGAIIGTFWGYKAFVFLPEGRSINTVFLQGSQKPVPLDFKLLCTGMEISHYPNGMVKQSRVDLTVLNTENRILLQKSSIVNDPLTYSGLTFYQADSYPIDEFFITIINRTTGQKQAFRVFVKQDMTWPGTDTSFRITELIQDKEGAVLQAKIRFAGDKNTAPTDFWIKDNHSELIRHSGQEFSITFHQLSKILFLVTKDPGIFVVYSGCILMLLGLAVSFFMSHQRIWILISKINERETRILVSGTSNKHKNAFEQKFRKLFMSLQQEFSDNKKAD